MLSFGFKPHLAIYCLTNTQKRFFCHSTEILSFLFFVTGDYNRHFLFENMMFFYYKFNHDAWCIRSKHTPSELASIAVDMPVHPNASSSLIKQPSNVDKPRPPKMLTCEKNFYQSDEARPTHRILGVCVRWRDQDSMLFWWDPMDTWNHFKFLSFSIKSSSWIRMPTSPVRSWCAALGMISSFANLRASCWYSFCSFVSS